MADENKKNIMEITDFCAPQLDIYARLSENQLLNRCDPEQGLFIAESPRVIERALDAGMEPVSCLVERRHIEGEAKEIIHRCIEDWDIPVYTAEFDVLTQITGYKLTRGMLCAMRRKALLGVQEVCKDARRLAVLENVVNPTNVGAIFRSAAALGIDGILLTPESSNPLYRRAIRVSMGTVFQIPWTFFEKGSWPQKGIRILKELGFQTAALALKEDSISIDDPQLLSEERLALILGTEGDGLASSTIAEWDYTVRIPRAQGVDSLNVAAASAVAFWETGKKRVSLLQET